MEGVVDKLGEFWGPAGIICAIQFLAIIYLYKAIQASEKEHRETLKSIPPLAQKFTQAMDMMMPIIMAKINGGDK